MHTVAGAIARRRRGPYTHTHTERREGWGVLGGHGEAARVDEETPERGKTKKRRRNCAAVAKS